MFLHEQLCRYVYIYIYLDMSERERKRETQRERERERERERRGEYTCMRMSGVYMHIYGYGQICWWN